MRFFKTRVEREGAVFADDRSTRPYTVSKKPVRLIAIRESKRRLRLGRTQFIYEIDGKLYYNENQDHPFYAEYSSDKTRDHHYRIFNSPTLEDRKWLKRNNIHVLGRNTDREEPTRCCLLAPDRKNPDGVFEFQDRDGSKIDDRLNSDIARWPNKWPDGIITYRYRSFSDDLSQKLQQRVLAVAIRMIGLQTKKIKFMRVREEAADPDLEIVFDSGHKGFEKNPRALAFAYLPTSRPRTSRFSGLCIFSDRYDWDVYGTKRGSQSLLHTLVHEILHALGFVHNEIEMDSVMYPRAVRKRIVFAGTDLEGIWKKYEKRVLPEWITRYFVDRRTKGFDFKRFS